jgi:hypothetical protein
VNRLIGHIVAWCTQDGYHKAGHWNTNKTCCDRGGGLEHEEGRQKVNEHLDEGDLAFEGDKEARRRETVDGCAAVQQSNSPGRVMESEKVVGWEGGELVECTEAMDIAHQRKRNLVSYYEL